MEKEFNPHGYRCVTNNGGYEIEISNSGDAARLRDSVLNTITDWMEIQYELGEDDNVEPFITDGKIKEYLSNYMRY